MDLQDIPRILRLPVLRSSSLTSASSSQSTNLRKYSAGSQKRRRGRTALARSWLSALDNQLTEGRAILILCIASEPQALGTGQAVGSARLTTTATRASLTATTNIVYTNIFAVHALSPLLFSLPFPPRQRCGVVSFIPKLASVNCIIINIPGLLFTVHGEILLFKSIIFL